MHERTSAAEATRYLRARYERPDGGALLAPWPAGVLPASPFGPNLLGYLLNQQHHADVAQALLREQLPAYGSDLAAGQRRRSLTANKELVHQEKAAVRSAGLETAASIGTEDTGARHQGPNGSCTVMGNDRVACCARTNTKSRLNFRHVLHGSEPLEAIKESTLTYWKTPGRNAALVEKMRPGPRGFAAAAAFQAWSGPRCRCPTTPRRPLSGRLGRNAKSAVVPGVQRAVVAGTPSPA